MAEQKTTGAGKAARAAIILAMAALAVFVFTRGFTPEVIKDRILAFGVWAPVVFVTLYTLRSLVLFPTSIFSLAGGLAFGTLYGGIYNYIGAMLSATLAFFVARKLGGEFAEKILKGKLKNLDDTLEREGFTILFYLRFFVPFDPLSYAVGLSRIKFSTFIIATAIPLIPGTFAFSNMGNAISGMKKPSDLLTPHFIVPLVILVLVMLIPIAVKKFGKSGTGGGKSAAPDS